MISTRKVTSWGFLSGQCARPYSSCDAHVSDIGGARALQAHGRSADAKLERQHEAFCFRRDRPLRASRPALEGLESTTSVLPAIAGTAGPSTAPYMLFKKVGCHILHIRYEGGAGVGGGRAWVAATWGGEECGGVWSGGRGRIRSAQLRDRRGEAGGVRPVRWGWGTVAAAAVAFSPSRLPLAPPSATAITCPPFPLPASRPARRPDLCQVRSCGRPCPTAAMDPTVGPRDARPCPWKHVFGLRAVVSWSNPLMAHSPTSLRNRVLLCVCWCAFHEILDGGVTRLLVKRLARIWPQIYMHRSAFAGAPSAAVREAATDLKHLHRRSEECRTPPGYARGCVLWISRYGSPIRVFTPFRFLSDGVNFGKSQIS